MFGAAKRDKPFKDYCLILQIHPEADAAMIDAAYWHLAKRYNEAAAYDSNTRAKLEELSEAYIVMGSAERRDEYLVLRAQMLGEGALPIAPAPVKAPLPLSMMNRQRPHEREEQEVEERREAFSVTRQVIVGAILVGGLTAGALAAMTSLSVALAAGGAILLAGLVAIAALAAWPRLKALKPRHVPHPRVVRMPGARVKRSKSEKPVEISLRAQTEQLRRIAAKSEPTHVVTPADDPADD